MKHYLFVLLAILYLSLPSLTQNLPPNFEYKRETGHDTGVPVFRLGPSPVAMAYDAERGESFEALAALVQPERDKFGVILFNCKRQRQLSESTDKTVVFILDGVKNTFKTPYTVMPQTISKGELTVEMAGLQISRQTFLDLLKAKDISVQFGKALYNLDKDNIAALRYFASEIDKDLKRRGKPGLMD